MVSSLDTLHRDGCVYILYGLTIRIWGLKILCHGGFKVRTKGKKRGGRRAHKTYILAQQRTYGLPRDIEGEGQDVRA